MMQKDAIEKIEGMAAPITLEFGERSYTSKQIHPVLDPMPNVVELNTLTGIEIYLKENPDGLELDQTMVHVLDPKEVLVFSRLTGKFEQRKPYLRSVHRMPEFNFGQYMDIETFIVEMQAKFEVDESTKAILQLMGTITEDMIRVYADDGITQEVTAKSGIGKVENCLVPNPVTLVPYRTFNEIAQPTGKFIFRLKAGRENRPGAALFEADGGAWQLDAIKRIRDWLRTKLPETVTILA